MSQIQECCTKRSNRRFVSSETEGAVTRTVERCAVCNRKHYSMTVPPIDVSVKGAAIA